MSSLDSDTRTRILAATAKLLVDKQGAGVRMSDIAKRVGISRQAVYLHFATRSDLLVATTQYVDQALNVDDRLLPSRQAGSGIERLERYIEFWAAYLPEIYGIAKALMAAKDSDEAAEAAWNDRMRAMREGCRAAVEALHRDGELKPWIKPKQATDILWTLLAIENWQKLTLDCQWSNAQYLRYLIHMAKLLLVKDA